jgi:selenocysteine lyase/cysteine desulfurase
MSRDVAAVRASFPALEAPRRLGLAPYNDDTDVDRLLAGLREFLAG